MNESHKEPVKLSLKDIEVMRDILSVVVQRGAIKAQEMETIGILYNKISAFLKQAENLEGTTREPNTQSSQEIRRSND